MQNKYLSALRTKYASFGLSKEALDRVALQRVKTIANEDEIDADIANSDTLMLIMKEMQSSADSQRNRAAQLQKDLDDLKNKQQPNSNPEPTPDSETSKQIQTLMEMVARMKAERDAEKKKAQDEVVITQVHEIMKKNGCNNDFIRKATLSGIKIGENDTADSLAEKYKSIYDQNFKEAYREGYVPPRGNGNGGNGENDKDAETAILKRAGLL